MEILASKGARSTWESVQMIDRSDKAIERHCILTGEKLTPANDSKAHVLASALGGRLKSRGILSNAANEELNDKFDLPLVQSFHPFMALLGGSRDRGENQPIQMTDAEGKRYHVSFGEPPKPARPEYERMETPKGTQYLIKVRSLKEARTLLGRVKKEHPDFNIEDALQHAAVQNRYPGRLGTRLQVGPRTLFPAAFSMASVFSAYHNLPSHPVFKSYVRAFSPDAPTMPVDTFYWLPRRAWFRAKAEISHILVLYGDARRHQALFYLELFNLPGVAVMMPYDGTNDTCKSYAVDVLEGKELTLGVDTADSKLSNGSPRTFSAMQLSSKKWKERSGDCSGLETGVRTIPR